MPRKARKNCNGFGLAGSGARSTFCVGPTIDATATAWVHRGFRSASEHHNFSQGLPKAAQEPAATTGSTCEKFDGKREEMESQQEECLLHPPPSAVAGDAAHRHVVLDPVLVTCRSRVICKKVASRSGTIGAESET